MLIIIKNGMRLCQDHNWRKFANYGTYKECVKEYKTKGPAIKRAKACGGMVIQLPDGAEIDAVGQVFHQDQRKSMEDFVIWKPEAKS